MGSTDGWKGENHSQFLRLLVVRRECNKWIMNANQWENEVENRRNAISHWTYSGAATCIGSCSTHRWRKIPSHSWTPMMPNMKNTKKHSSSTLPSIGKVSSNSITSIRMPWRSERENTRTDKCNWFEFYVLASTAKVSRSCAYPTMIDFIFLRYPKTMSPRAGGAARMGRIWRSEWWKLCRICRSKCFLFGFIYLLRRYIDSRHTPCTTMSLA